MGPGGCGAFQGIGIATDLEYGAKKGIARCNAFPNNVELIMNMPAGLLSSKVLRLVCVLAIAVGVSSCKTLDGGSGSPYASSDGGGYNPYPNGGGGTVSSSSVTPGGTQPHYAEAPPPPPPGFDRPSEKFESEPEPKHTSSSAGKTKTKKSSGEGSAKTSSTEGASKKKSTVEGATKKSGTEGAAKKKSSTEGTAKKKSTEGGGYVSSGGNVHVVTMGDTLYSIAVHNKTTVAKLKALNHMKSNVVSPGQKIKVQ